MIFDFIFKSDPTIKRHILKTITWRIVGTVDTVVIGWFITGNAWTGIKIGGVEVITKMTLYFLHERVWFRINFGLTHRSRKND